MTEARETRRALKGDCLALLDSVAVEHPTGHQSKLAARYVIVSQSGERIGVMFEKHESVPAQLWIAHRYAKDLSDGATCVREYKAEELYRSSEADAEPTYRRHAALKSMRDLANVDLLRFTVEYRAELERIVSHLVAL
jgi:hypothetical protein